MRITKFIGQNPDRIKRVKKCIKAILDYDSEWIISIEERKGELSLFIDEKTPDDVFDRIKYVSKTVWNLFNEEKIVFSKTYNAPF